MRAKPGVKGARDVPVAQGGLRGRGRVCLSRSRKDDDARATPGSARVTGGVAAARSEARSAGSAQQLGTRTAGTRARRACTENALIQAALLNRVAVSPPNCRALEASPAGHVAARSAPRRPATPRNTPRRPARPRPRVPQLRGSTQGRRESLYVLSGSRASGAERCPAARPGKFGRDARAFCTSTNG